MSSLYICNQHISPSKKSLHHGAYCRRLLRHACRVAAFCKLCRQTDERYRHASCTMDSGGILVFRKRPSGYGDIAATTKFYSPAAETSGSRSAVYYDYSAPHRRNEVIKESEQRCKSFGPTAIAEEGADSISGRHRCAIFTAV